VALAPGVGHAADPDLEWFTLTTEHFHLHYHQGGEAFARRSAAIAEEARATLLKATGWTPHSDRVHLTCHDLSDGANGFARVQPYDALTLLAFGPEADTDLGRYDDWLRVLIYHELSHLLHLDQAGGVVGVVNTIFGKTLLPNLALPRWFIEGIATYAESRHTPLGRVGSAQFEMYLRSAALGGTLPESIGGLTGSPISRPGGSWAYVFGGDFLTWVADRHGDATLIEFGRLYGRRLLPYGLNNVARQAFGEDFEQLYAAWRADLVARAKAVESRERKAGLITGHKLTTEGWSHNAPAFDHSGRRIALTKSNGHEASSLHVGTLDGDKLTLERLYQCYGNCGRSMWSPDDSEIISVGSRWYGPHRYFRDLVSYNLETRPARPTRLTHGQRSREPDLRQDGRTVVFVTGSWGRTALMEHDLRTQQTRTLIGFDRKLQLNQPRYLPDGRIVFSAQGNGGFRDLWLRETDGRLVRLTTTPEREIGAAVSPDGSTVYYSSDHGGIWNIHALDLRTRARRQVTRVLGGAFNPSVSPDGRQLIYNGYSAVGFDLFLVPLDGRSTPVTDTVQSVERPYNPRPVDGRIRPYRGYRSAWPRTWSPVFQLDQTGLGGVGVEIGAQDALGHHSWTLGVDYSLLREDVSIATSYSYSGLRPSMNVFLARFRGDAYRYIRDEVEVFAHENLYAAAGISTSIPHVEHTFHIGADVSYLLSVDPNPPVRLHHDPGSDEPFVQQDNQRVSIELFWSYDHVKRYALSISPDEGWRAGMAFRLTPHWLGNTSERWAMSWHFDTYFPMPWWHSNVLVFKLKGGVSGGEAPDSFSVGGFPQQDLVMDLINERGLFGSYLRGYPSGAFRGDAFHLLTSEYRLPVLDLFTAAGTLPLWLERLTAAVFSDAGMAYYDDATLDHIKVTVGGEVALRTELFYAVPFTLRVGYARAVTDPPAEQLYIILGSNL